MTESQPNDPGSMVRNQASLILPDRDAIEAVRWQYNPVQANLIPAHVTLCREDEVQDWERLTERAMSLMPMDLVLGFGRPMRQDGLVAMPVVSGVETFDAIRERLLSEGGVRPRRHTPHLTLIHPRNGTCSDAEFEALSNRLTPFVARFDRIHWIQQRDGGVWSNIQCVGPSQEMFHHDLFEK